MTTPLASSADTLLAALADTRRGPRQNGVFALWIFLRACDGLMPPGPLSPRTHRRRLQALERRLSSLSLPAPLRRALALAIDEITDGGADAAAVALQHLAAPARETLGSEVGDAVTGAAHEARTAMHQR